MTAFLIRTDGTLCYYAGIRQSERGPDGDTWSERFDLAHQYAQIAPIELTAPALAAGIPILVVTSKKAARSYGTPNRETSFFRQSATTPA